MLPSPREKPRWRRRSRLAAVTAATLVVAAAVAVTAPAVAGVAGVPPVREIGVAAGLPTALTSYAMRARDVDGDGRVDLLLVHHGGPTQLYTNTPAGFVLRHTFEDTLHGERDRHDCDWADVDLDGRLDLACAKGAAHGTARKHNELWIQQPDGTFADRAADFGVLDRWGRGRRTTFLDINGDAYPDLFVGNEFPRKDDRRTPSRTFVNVGGERFRRVNVGLTRETGARCVDVADVDRDGRDDLLVCENAALRIYLRHGRRFVDATRSLGVPQRKTVWARLVDVDADDRLDLVAITRANLSVRLGRRDGFGAPVRFAVRQGRGFAVGDVDGDGHADVFVVQACDDGVNVDDTLLLGAGDGVTWTPVAVPGGAAGCGDTAIAADLDLDGRDDVVVSNGGGQRAGTGIRGPDQIFTMGDWLSQPA